MIIYEKIILAAAFYKGVHMIIDPQKVTIADVIHRWFDNRLSARFTFYAGRPPSRSDLNTEVLEKFYDSIRCDVGQEEATNFVRFVNKLDDLAMTSFLVAFERFWGTSCKVVEIEQFDNDHVTVSEHDGALFAIMASASNSMSADDIHFASYDIKREFIDAHIAEIPEGERRAERSFFSRLSSY